MTSSTFFQESKKTPILEALKGKINKSIVDLMEKFIAGDIQAGFELLDRKMQIRFGDPFSLYSKDILTSKDIQDISNWKGVDKFKSLIEKFKQTRKWYCNDCTPEECLVFVWFAREKAFGEIDGLSWRELSRGELEQPFYSSARERGGFGNSFANLAYTVIECHQNDVPQVVCELPTHFHRFHGFFGDLFSRNDFSHLRQQHYKFGIKHKDARAMSGFAWQYFEGKNIVSAEEALDLFSQSALQGDWRAILGLCNLYLKGKAGNHQLKDLVRYMRFGMECGFVLSNKMDALLESIKTQPYFNDPYYCYHGALAFNAVDKCRSKSPTVFKFDPTVSKELHLTFNKLRHNEIIFQLMKDSGDSLDENFQALLLHEEVMSEGIAIYREIAKESLCLPHGVINIIVEFYSFFAMNQTWEKEAQEKSKVDTRLVELAREKEKIEKEIALLKEKQNAVEAGSSYIRLSRN